LSVPSVSTAPSQFKYYLYYTVYQIQNSVPDPIFHRFLNLCMLTLLWTFLVKKFTMLNLATVHVLA